MFEHILFIDFCVDIVSSSSVVELKNRWLVYATKWPKFMPTQYTEICTWMKKLVIEYVAVVWHWLVWTFFMSCLLAFCWIGLVYVTPPRLHSGYISIYRVHNWKRLSGPVPLMYIKILDDLSLPAECVWRAAVFWLSKGSIIISFFNFWQNSLCRINLEITVMCTSVRSVNCYNWEENIKISNNSHHCAVSTHYFYSYYILAYFHHWG